MNKYYSIALLFMAGAVSYLPAMEEGIEIKLAGAESSIISQAQLDAFLDIIDPDLKDELGGLIGTPAFQEAGKAGFDFIIQNVDAFINNDTDAINTAFDGLYASNDSESFVSMLELANYLNSQLILNAASSYIAKKTRDMLKNNPAFLVAILKAQNKYKGLRFFPMDARLTKAGDTPLIGALLTGNENIASLLLKGGANPFLTSKEYGTALAIAERKNLKDTIKLLKEAGITYITKNVPEHKSDNPDILSDKLVEFYTENNLPKFIAFLEAAAASENKAIFEGAVGFIRLQRRRDQFKALAKKHPEFLSTFIDFFKRHQQSLESYDLSDFLVLATLQGDPKIVELFLGAGADIHTADDMGNTLLAVAAKYGKKEMVKMLLENGADPNRRGEIHPLMQYVTLEEQPGKQYAYSSPLDLAKGKEIRLMLRKYGAKEE